MVDKLSLFILSFTIKGHWSPSIFNSNFFIDKYLLNMRRRNDMDNEEAQRLQEAARRVARQLEEERIARRREEAERERRDQQASQQHRSKDGKRG